MSFFYRMMPRFLDFCNLYLYYTATDFSISTIRSYLLLAIQKIVRPINIINSYILSNIHFHSLLIKNNTFTLEFKIHHFHNYTFKPMVTMLLSPLNVRSPELPVRIAIEERRRSTKKRVARWGREYRPSRKENDDDRNEEISTWRDGFLCFV